MTKKREWNERHASGRVRLTVAGQYYSFSSQWLVTDCLCYSPISCQGDKHQSSTRPRPSTRHFPYSSWLLVFYPVKPVLHLLPAFQLLYSHQVTSSGGGEMICKCTLCVVVSYTARWGQTHTATSWRWDPAACWGCWTGLLHLLWEADWRGERGER